MTETDSTLARIPRDVTVGGLLERAARSTRGVRFLDRREENRFHGYDELLDRARRAAGGLAARGVRPGDRVALILPTGPDFYDAFFGALLAGAVPAPLYPPVRLGRLSEYRVRTARLLAGCGARIVVTDRSVSRLIGRAVARAAPPLGLATAAELRAGPAGAATGRRESVDPAGVALIQHSSGTTGEPRPVRLTHRALIDNIDAIRRRLHAAYPEAGGIEHATVSWLPLYHDMGLIGCVLTSLAHPVDLTLIPPELFVARPAVWLRTISKWGGTVSGAPNFAYSYCADRIRDEELEGVDLSSWLVALNGAEPVTCEAMDRFTARFAPYGLPPTALTPVYGLAEATLAVTFSDPEAPLRRISLDRDALAEEGLARPAASGGATFVSVGRPLAGVRLRIVPEAGTEPERAGPPGGAGRPGGATPESGATPQVGDSCGEGVVGRILVGGASLFDGYDDDPEDAAASADGPDGAWFDTGDRGFVLDGELYIHGRMKDVVIVRGRKYAPHVVERALEGVDGIRTGCVAAFCLSPEDAEEERVFILAERARGRRPGSDPDLAEAATARVIDRVGIPCEPVIILEPGTLPRTSSGKIRRSEARRRYAEGELAPPAGATIARALVETIRSRFAVMGLRGERPDADGSR